MIARSFIREVGSWMGATACSSHRRHAAILAAAFAAFAGSGAAFGQSCGPGTPGALDCGPVEHAISVAASCSPRCVGEFLNCTGSVISADPFLDPFLVKGAFNTVRGVVRDPAVGDLEINAVTGNAICTGGAACTGVLPNAGCTFPCLIGPTGKTCGDAGSGLTLPGAPASGAIQVVDRNLYTILVTDAPTLSNVFNFTIRDLCDSGCTSCAANDDSALKGSSTPIPTCGDSDPCNIDCCELGVCSHPSTCVGATCRDVNGNVTVFPPLVCNDNSVCTGPDTCNAALPNSTPQQCCEYPPHECPLPPVCFTQGPCDPVTGCPPPVSDCVTNPTLCDDNNVCTRDICDESAPGCCRYEDLPCPVPPVCFTQGPCDPVTGCPPLVSDCVSNPTLCEDNNACTRDICDESAPGCCRHEDILCPLPPVCFTQGPCNPATGCPAPVSDCVTNPTLCDDGDPCTTDICNESAPGCCVHTGSCPCSVTIDKTVAPDTDCNGVADPGSTFEDSVEVDKIECVVYMICVTNTGDQTLNTSGVTVSDDHLGIVDINFGTIPATNPNTTVCKLIASEISSPECGGGLCVCQDVEGQNTARVSSAICEVTQDSACDLNLHPDSDCSDNARVNCTGGCRITAGRTNRLDKVVDGAQGPRGQGGGQVGAPCGCSGCFTTGDPEADLAFEHIQGNWQYDRKYPGADQFKQGTFHAKEFNSLICGCCSADLPNCTEGGINQNPGAGACFKQGATRDPLNGKVCGDRITGPLPRPAGANIICFYGIGDWTPTNGRKLDKVAFRVEAEDRGEPSVKKNTDETCDYHRIRIWVPAAGEDAKVLADQACCTTALDDNLDVPGIRLPNIDDGGNLLHGNIQIHPALPNTNRGRCPVPDGTCQQSEE